MVQGTLRGLHGREACGDEGTASYHTEALPPAHACGFRAEGTVFQGLGSGSVSMATLTDVGLVHTGF